MKIVKSFIPKHIKKSTVLAVYDLLRRKTNWVSEKVIRQNAAENRRLLHSDSQIYIPQKMLENSKEKHFYIENQAQWGAIKFGKGRQSNMSCSGCGVIAAYNALAAMREDVSADSMVALIGSFERDGAAVNGRLGIAPRAIYDYFKDRGFKTCVATDYHMEAINQIGREYDAVIVTAYNNKNDITDRLHTVCITKRENGEYVIHNGYRKNAASGAWEENRTGVFTLTDAIPQIGRDSAAISVIGINRQMV